MSLDGSWFQEKLDKNQYEKLEAFEADVNRVFENARVYNMPKSEIYNDAVALQVRRLRHPRTASGNTAMVTVRPHAPLWTTGAPSAEALPSVHEGRTSAA